MKYVISIDWRSFVTSLLVRRRMGLPLPAPYSGKYSTSRNFIHPFPFENTINCMQDSKWFEFRLKLLSLRFWMEFINEIISRYGYLLNLYGQLSRVKFKFEEFTCVIWNIKPLSSKIKKTHIQGSHIHALRQNPISSYLVWGPILRYIANQSNLQDRQRLRDA